jgi:hypothetical protein
MPKRYTAKAKNHVDDMTVTIEIQANADLSTVRKHLVNAFLQAIQELGTEPKRTYAETRVTQSLSKVVVTSKDVLEFRSVPKV